jgi:hypothetical protein
VTPLIDESTRRALYVAPTAAEVLALVDTDRREGFDSDAVQG